MFRPEPSADFFTVSATWARQNFPEVITRSMAGPVGIQRHRRVLAVVYGLPFESTASRERELAHLRVFVPQLQRQLFHSQLAMRLLLAGEESGRTLIERARSVMRTWDWQITVPAVLQDRWNSLLEQPLAEIARQIVRTDRDGFALRDASPYFRGDVKEMFIENQERTLNTYKERGLAEQARLWDEAQDRIHGPGGAAMRRAIDPNPFEAGMLDPEDPRHPANIDPRAWRESAPASEAEGNADAAPTGAFLGRAAASRAGLGSASGVGSPPGLAPASVTVPVSASPPPPDPDLAPAPDIDGDADESFETAPW